MIFSIIGCGFPGALSLALSEMKFFLGTDIKSCMTTHASDTDLERCCLGMIQEGPELDALEEHLLICGECVDPAEASRRLYS